MSENRDVERWLMDIMRRRQDTHRVWRVLVATIGADSIEAMEAYDEWIETERQYEHLLKITRGSKVAIHGSKSSERRRARRERIQS